MSLPKRLLIGLIIGLVAATITATLKTGALYDVTLLIGFVLAGIVTVLATQSASAASSSAAQDNSNDDYQEQESPSSHSDGDREFGEVKWFNVTKGFGFIIREDGEEIFVHFRSIRGQNRRGLRDGQRVSFVVANSDKGPQAEDVQAEED